MRSTLFASMPLLLSLAAPAAAQPPHVTNGTLTPQPAGANLQATFTSLVARQASPGWIGYAVPAAKGVGTSCWSDNHDATSSSRVHLEGPTTIYVLYRVDAKAVEKIRFYSEDCELDAGGLTLAWIENVKPSDSIALLSTFVSNGVSRMSNGALAAIASHGDAAVVPALATFARQDPNTKVRGEALFWLAQKAGKQAESEITAAIENDPDTEVKRRAVFALSQLPKDEGVPLLINLAKNNRNPVVRKQAMFWLGQSKDPRALAFFEQVLAK